MLSNLEHHFTFDKIAQNDAQYEEDDESTSSEEYPPMHTDAEETMESEEAYPWNETEVFEFNDSFSIKLTGKCC
jgi:hypothetical protein